MNLWRFCGVDYIKELSHEGSSRSSHALAWSGSREPDHAKAWACPRYLSELFTKFAAEITLK